MAYDVRFDVSTPGAGDLAKVDALIAKLAGSTKVAAGDLKVFESVLRADVAAGNSLAESLRTIASTSTGGYQGLAQLAKQAQSYAGAATEAATATRYFTSSTTEARFAAQLLGRELGVAMPRALSSIAAQSSTLAPILNNLFPIVAAAGFGQVLLTLAEKYDPVISATKRLAESTKEFEQAFGRLESELARLDVESVVAKLGRIAGLEEARLYPALKAKRDQEDLAETGRLIDEATRKLGALSGYSTIPLIGGILGHFAQGTSTDLDILYQRQARQKMQVFVDQAQEQRDKDEEAKVRRDQAERDAKEAQRKLDEQRKRAQALAASEVERGLSNPLARAYYQANARLATFTDPWSRGIVGGAAVSEIAGIGGQFQRKELEAGAKAEEEKTKELIRSFVETLRESTHQLEEQVQEDKRVAAFQNALTRQSGGEAVRAITERGAFAQRITALDPRLTAAEKIAALTRLELATAQEKHRQDIENARAIIELEENKGEREKALREADRDYRLETQKIEDEHQERLLELQNKRIEAFRNTIGGLFDALTSRQPGEVPNFLKSQVLNQAKIFTENAAQDYLVKPLQQAIPHFGGALTRGTIFEKSPLDASAVKLTVAGGELSGAATALTGAAAAIRGGGMVPGGTTAGSVIGYDSEGLPIRGPNAALFPSLGGSAFGRDLSNFGSGASSVLRGYGLSTLTDPGFNLSTRIGAGVGLAGMGLAGGYGIYSGLKQGGAGGDLKAAGSAAGLAGGLVSNVSNLLHATSGLLTAIPIVGSIAAMALPLLGGLFNGPQRRANQISRELSAAQFNAPIALNVTQSSGGTFADFDARGNLRTSGFSAVPTVRQTTQWEQTHGLFGGPPTWWTVPGGQTGQFGAPVVNNYNTTVHAVDAPSFQNLLDKNHAAVGNAVAKALQNSHSSLASEVQHAVRS